MRLAHTPFPRRLMQGVGEVQQVMAAKARNHFQQLQA